MFSSVDRRHPRPCLVTLCRNRNRRCTIPDGGLACRHIMPTPMKAGYGCRRSDVPCESRILASPTWRTLSGSRPLVAYVTRLPFASSHIAQWRPWPGRCDPDACRHRPHGNRGTLSRWKTVSGQGGSGDDPSSYLRRYFLMHESPEVPASGLRRGWLGILPGTGSSCDSPRTRWHGAQTGRLACTAHGAPPYPQCEFQ